MSFYVSFFSFIIQYLAENKNDTCSYRLSFKV